MVELFVRKDVAFRAFKIALIVGVILAGINHGDHIIKGEMTGNNWIKIIITFCVPYCVSSFSSAMAKIVPKFNDTQLKCTNKCK